MSGLSHLQKFVDGFHENYPCCDATPTAGMRGGLD
jgi:hypothetical protein